MLNFNIDGNLNCQTMCQQIDRYIKKFIQENGHDKYILNIQIKKPIDGNIDNKKLTGWLQGLIDISIIICSHPCNTIGAINSSYIK